ncbi:hypothetical protein TSUD_13850 [Trifolium subterraneum]|uniref:DUF3700 domain-containing protein n=1 Tax=Trifolium subterraneum TaxID=3900 RepID=A0A2Z6NHV1_TRISU|nr:hypothetical protein TSUD_13850 [Trifolium subterraneum]
MLAVFNKSVAKSPEGLQSPESNSVSSLKDGFLAQHFASLNPSSVTLNLASSGLLAYSVHKDNPLLPRTLRDRGPYPADQVVRDFQGKFAFILYDSSSQAAFVAADAEGSVPFFWGIDADESLVLSDDTEIVRKSCGKSYAPFPKGCFFTTSGGLRSFEHPLNELKPIPRIDSSGQVCGSTYKVDADSKKETTGMPRVGSAANWSSEY